MEDVDPLQMVKDKHYGLPYVKAYISRHQTATAKYVDKRGYTLLDHAIMEQRDPKIIKALCDNMVRAGIRNTSTKAKYRFLTGNTSALHIACIFKDAASLKILIRSGIFDIDTIDIKGQTPVYICAANGAHSMLKELLMSGGDQKIPGPKKATPLCIASDRGWIKCVQILLSFKPGKDIFSSKYLPLFGITPVKFVEDVVKPVLAVESEFNETIVPAEKSYVVFGLAVVFVIVNTNDAPGVPFIVISLNAPFAGIRDLSISNPVIKLT